MKKSINRNYFWSELFVDQLLQFGVRNVCISPGSRNTPLTFAFANTKYVKTYVHVDERSSGFFALGLAKSTGNPVAVVTTSGTAVAELYPAIIEAFIQRIPLIICTADRPYYLRNTGANQTINQDNIFKNQIRGFVDFGLPVIKKTDLKRLVKKTSGLMDIAVSSDPGPVHFNFPFIKPLEPHNYTERMDFTNDSFLLNGLKTKESKEVVIPEKIIKLFNKSRKPLLHCGWGNVDSKFIRNLFQFSAKSSIPILADGTSEVRFFNGSNKNIITNHSAFLNSLSDEPDLIIQFGNAPTSQSVLRYFENASAVRVLINQFGDIKDPSKSKGILQKANPNEFIKKLDEQIGVKQEWVKWKEYITSIDKVCELEKANIIGKSHFGMEPRVANEILKLIPRNSNIFISNSLPIRDFDYFASKRKGNFKIFTNRGASGIDGIISTASGVAVSSKNQSILIIGDLAFFHNISALATLNELNIPLKIILINNNGGGIFKMLPVSKEDKNQFSRYFLTSQNIKFSKILNAFSVKYYTSKSWTGFEKSLKKAIDDKSPSVLEIITDSSSSATLRKKYWERILQKLQ